ncbi:MAG: NAD-dependent epimerase/dehydratase family protein [Phycisphaerales bacterium]|nr:NAD-dependent epimerase/dehydratase family protein [Phycisphaerales bacterium]
MTRSSASTQQSCGLALVTGGGGFLGAAIVRQLLDAGWRVRTVSRGDYPALREIGVETLRGDLADAGIAEQAARGCDAVLHVAAKAGVWGRLADYRRANVDATQRVIDACVANRVARLVFTSSPSVVFSGDSVENGDESLPYPSHHHSHYSATKAEAERIVLTANSAGLHVAALRPHLIWGPRDPHIVPRLIARARSGRLRRIGPGDNIVDTTYVENAALAHICALRAIHSNPKAAGRAYFITNGEPMRLWNLIDQIIACADLPPIRKSISFSAATRIGGLLEGVYRLLRLPGEPPMTRFVARELATSHFFDISAAKRELGYEPRVTIAEGLVRLKNWLRDQRP